MRTAPKTTRQRPTTQSQTTPEPPARPRWPVFAAAAWAVVFAGFNVQWELGGRFGAHLMRLDEVVADPAFILANRVAIVAKLAAGALALASLHPAAAKGSRRLLLQVALWGGGAVLILHGLAFAVQGVLLATGVIPAPVDVPAEEVAHYLRWSLGVWEPYWLLGGVLFLLTANRHRLVTRPIPTAA